ncbi:MAG: hypothetical protein R3C42_07050 [Parvularculaceae bacterium]
MIEAEISGGVKPKIKICTRKSPHKLKGDERRFFLSALDQHTSRLDSAENENGRKMVARRFSLTERGGGPVFSRLDQKKLAAVADRMGVEVEPIYPNELSNLAEFDALFIRATTAIDNFTYRFARRAEQEGMPVIEDAIDDPLHQQGFPEGIARQREYSRAENRNHERKTNIAEIMDRLGSPVVLKAPDGSFSRSVCIGRNWQAISGDSEEAVRRHRAHSRAGNTCRHQFDWRVGVLDGEPLFACRYKEWRAGTGRSPSTKKTARRLSAERIRYRWRKRGRYRYRRQMRATDRRRALRH